MDFHLQQLEQKSIYILREVKARFKNPAVLWSMGKDSTAMLALCRRAFFGRVPFPVINLDSGHDLQESYDFREKIVKEWGLNLIIGKVKHEADAISGTTEGLNKAETLKKLLDEYRFDALIVSIRRDEHGIRAKERYFCFPPNIFIYGKDVKPIKDIKKGDLVFSHEGFLREVLAISRRKYKGELVEIIPNYGLPIRLTPNHPLLSKKLEPSGKFRKYRLKGFDGKIYEGDMELTGCPKIKWNPASKIEKGDKIFIPKVKFSNPFITDLSLADIIAKPNLVEKDNKLYYKSAHLGSPKIPALANLSPALLRTFGYYVAEGSISRAANQIFFAFNRNEKELIKDLLNTIKENFGLKGTVRERGENGTEVYFSSKVLSFLFSKLCGKGAKNKKLPFFFTKLNDDQLIQLVKGCWLGDGSNETYSTRSATLAHQLRLALLRLGILSSIKVKSAKETGQKIIQIVGASKEDFKKLFTIESKVEYDGRFNLVGEVTETPRVNSKGSHPKTGGFWIKVKSVRRIPYQGPLFNLHVDGPQTYLAEGVAVHNSPRDKSFKWNFENQPPEVFHYISEFKDASHVRIHPLLHWTELDVWMYTKEKEIPFNPLYLAKDGKRFRSLGFKEVTHSVKSDADTIDKIIEELKTTDVAERSGRELDKEKEYVMQRLRELGYM